MASPCCEEKRLAAVVRMSCGGEKNVYGFNVPDCCSSRQRCETDGILRVNDRARYEKHTEEFEIAWVRSKVKGGGTSGTIAGRSLASRAWGGFGTGSQ
jgi:hypothetical protein